jgi:hypothetical protein
MGSDVEKKEQERQTGNCGVTLGGQLLVGATNSASIKKKRTAH